MLLKIAKGIQKDWKRKSERDCVDKCSHLLQGSTPYIFQDQKFSCNISMPLIIQIVHVRINGSFLKLYPQNL